MTDNIQNFDNEKNSILITFLVTTGKLQVSWDSMGADRYRLFYKKVGDVFSGNLWCKTNKVSFSFVPKGNWEFFVCAYKNDALIAASEVQTLRYEQADEICLDEESRFVNITVNPTEEKELFIQWDYRGIADFFCVYTVYSDMAIFRTDDENVCGTELKGFRDDTKFFVKAFLNTFDGELLVAESKKVGVGVKAEIGEVITYAADDTLKIKDIIPPDVFADYLEFAYQKKKDSVRLPGFRKGTAPRKLIEKEIGVNKLYELAAEQCMNKAGAKLRENCGELTEGKPVYQILQNEPQKPFEYSAEFKIHRGFAEMKCRMMEYVKNDPDVLLVGIHGIKYAVFLSATVMKKRARVFTGRGNSPEEAACDVTKQFMTYFQKKDTTHMVLKLDIVKNIQKVSLAEVRRGIKQAPYQKFYRKGIAFDNQFEIAFLEQQTNAFQIYDYENATISLERLNKYLKIYGKEEMNQIPEELYIFDTQSWVCDSQQRVFPLYSGGMENGRRVVSKVDVDCVKGLVSDASEYLIRQIHEDGSFTYGYYPSFDRTLSSYNILRHAGTVWSMMCADDILKNPDIQKAVTMTIDHMLEHYVEFPDENRAYVIERKADEIKLGGNGIAVIMLAKYMENYKDRDYTELIQLLANGILTMQNPKTGKYTHVLSFPDYQVKEEMRTVYYDGESTYALCLAYGITGDQRYIEAAGKALDYQIENDYVRYRDHWLAYAFNAYIPYNMQEKYVDFALRNAKDNLKIIYKQETVYHTYLELLTMTLDTYLHCKENGFHSAYFDRFDVSELTKVIRYRAWHMLDGFWYPEYAMYMGRPECVLGSFFVRHDGFRTRIDDDQHFIDGYVKYAKLYDFIVEQ